MSEESEWEFAITREARQEWAQMDEPYRSHVLRRLMRIGEGLWLQDGNTTCIKANKSLNLELWRTKFSKSGRIVFEVILSPSYSPC
jgi:mRNA-degrading endonuclease RelE of RelBE toxin-antitoxin system